jgi:hypothetical protein
MFTDLFERKIFLQNSPVFERKRLSSTEMERRGGNSSFRIVQFMLVVRSLIDCLVLVVIGADIRMHASNLWCGKRTIFK